MQTMVGSSATERSWEGWVVPVKNSFVKLVGLELAVEHRWQTQDLRAKSGPPPCFYPAAAPAPSSLPLVKE